MNFNNSLHVKKYQILGCCDVEIKEVENTLEESNDQQSFCC